QIAQAGKDRALNEQEIEIASQRKIYLLHRDTAQKTEALEAQMESVALRRSGKPLESAIKRVEASLVEAKHGIQNQAEELARPFELSGKSLFDKGDVVGAQKQVEQAAKIYKDANDQIAALERQSAETVGDLRDEDARRQLEDKRAANSELL